MAIKWNKIFGIGSFLGCAVAMAAGASLYIYKMELLGFSRAPSALDDTHTVTVVIERGSNTRVVAEQLHDAGVITDEVLFEKWVRYVAKQEGTIKAGTYQLSPSMAPQDILAVLQTGRDAERRFTVPEGLRKEEIAQVLETAGFGAKQEILKSMGNANVIADFGVPDGVAGGVDGYLFPDTYQFAAGTGPEKILRRMRARLDEVVDPRMRTRMTELGWDLHKTLTLASIIEKETGAPEERPHISAVFHNRLKQGMRLQTDPTVIYGTPDYQGSIKKSDLLRDHPYNTYVIAGLPPGPIAQPGKAAIEAALWPSTDAGDADDLYFVAKGDSGRHEFCKDLACHNAAVEKWLRPKPD